MDHDKKSFLAEFSRRAMQRLQDKKIPKYRTLHVPSLDADLKFRNLSYDEITECMNMEDTGDPNRSDKYCIYLAAVEPSLKDVAREIMDTESTLPADQRTLLEPLDVVGIFDIGEIQEIAMQNVNQVCVIEKGALCGVVLDGSYNLTEATYKTSLQKLVDRVIVTDKNGNQTSVVEDAGAQSKYGVVQRVYKQEEGKDATSEAKSLLYIMDQSATVTAASDTRAVSGYAIAVQEATTGLYGKFYIESDTHTFEDGKEMMQLTLAFSNMMDEKEAGS